VPEEKRKSVKIIALTTPSSEGCKQLQQEVSGLSGDYDIDLVVVDLEKFSEDEITKAFGKVDVVPTTIVETTDKSNRIIGYKQGELRGAIEEVLVSDD
jgi:hypothetical protein